MRHVKEHAMTYSPRSMFQGGQRVYSVWEAELVRGVSTVCGITAKLFH
jgi:hypothetical protein